MPPTTDRAGHWYLTFTTNYVENDKGGSCTATFDTVNTALRNIHCNAIRCVTGSNEHAQLFATRLAIEAARDNAVELAEQYNVLARRLNAYLADLPDSHDPWAGFTW